MKRSITVLMFVFLAGLILAPLASAHKVTIFAWAEGDTVYTESKFSGGKRVIDGKVEVFDPAGTLLLDGQTNDKGEFSFKAPRISDLKIVLTAGMGHQSSWTLSAAELGRESAAPVPPAPAAETPDVSAPPAVASGLTAEEIEAIVARQLEQKIHPLTRMVAAAQDKGPSVSDVIGGIGYIIGLVGLGAYMRYRKDGRA
ncbi:hypothetical protein [Desulfosarcina ovata]|uniref:Nickel transport protein n=1 Tax=Desulfosarcina ovata subsp. ovata TaxID=2752305 RepID=A0A5K8ADD4_9BACT|nr:hypothetical protein [Desulfosarcina ovata]BBO89950.1 hypothetical protein DSCOOX_31300 [Desulfosarcina ovata subsp. ovata]